MNQPKVLNLRYWLVTWCIYCCTFIMLYFSAR